MDGIMLFALAQELQEKILGTRVGKIYQHPSGEIILTLRRPGEDYQLLLCGGPHFPRIYLTSRERENPKVPPAFCMLLRKHLEGARLLSIRQPGVDRVIELVFEPGWSGKGKVQPALVLEIMGRHSNLILVDELTNSILGSQRTITETMSRRRQVAPGLPYLPPPAHGKLDLTRASRRDIEALAESLTAPTDQAFIDNLAGVGPFTAKALARCSQEIGPLECLLELAGRLRENSFTPVLLGPENAPLGVCAIKATHLAEEEVRVFASPSKALETFYEARLTGAEREELRRQLITHVNTTLARVKSRLAKQAAALAKARQAEEMRLKGELLMSHLHLVDKGAEKAALPNYYADNELVEVDLDPRLSPVQNAEEYFRRYRKAKKSEEIVRRQLDRTQVEMKALESLAREISDGQSLEGLAAIKADMEAEGYLPVQGKAPRRPPTRPRHFYSRDGYLILVGRSSRQNDHLTNRMANPDDIWMHAKGVSGSHVIIRTGGKEVPPTTLLDGAMLAAYYSAARSSSNVAVDYVQRRHVRKPAGAPPGMVIYDHHKTLFVTPQEDLLPKEQK
ncbi:MAG: fibronectin-binding domain-containing protein [Firmicutes bacterium]|nr:fibronectin-binding domain-containing protein [Bacillota bacterium]